MRIRCAWCGRIVINKPPFKDKEEITDGICDACFDEEMGFIEAQRLNKLPGVKCSL